MKHERFREHWKFWRSELVLAVMADDQVLNQSLQLVGETGYLRELCLQHLQLNDHVPEQLPARGVCKRAVVRELIDLADVVQEYSRQQQVAVDLRIISAQQVTRLEQRNHVIKQAPDVSVMQRLGGRSIAISFRNLWIGHECFDQGFEVGILKSRDKSC